VLPRLDVLTKICHMMQPLMQVTYCASSDCQSPALQPHKLHFLPFRIALKMNFSIECLHTIPSDYSLNPSCTGLWSTTTGIGGGEAPPPVIYWRTLETSTIDIVTTITDIGTVPRTTSSSTYSTAYITNTFTSTEATTTVVYGPFVSCFPPQPLGSLPGCADNVEPRPPPLAFSGTSCPNGYQSLGINTLNGITTLWCCQRLVIEFAYA
jgi:hypothetical protein